MAVKDFLCPRRDEIGMAIVRRERDVWNLRDGHQSCSFCGSLSPDEVFAAIEAGYEFGPTDKNYKVYVHLPNPKAGKREVVGRSTGPAYGFDGKPSLPDLTWLEKWRGRYDRKIMGAASPFLHGKFYFQHFSVAQQQRFVDLLNHKKIKFGYPGYFYRLPFFVGPSLGA